MAAARPALKVLHLAQDALPYSTGGVEVYVARLARAQRDAGADVEILAGRDVGRPNSYEVRREVVGGLPLTTIGHHTGNDRFHSLRVAANLDRFDSNPRIDHMVAEIVRATSPDVVHVHHLVHLSTTLLDGLKRLGVPMMVTLHDYWWLCVAGQLLNGAGVHEPEACGEPCLRYLMFNRHKAFGRFGALLAASTRMRSRRFGRWVQQRQRNLVAAINLADLVVAPSSSLAERYIRRGVDRRRLEVSDYGTDLDAIPRRLRVRNGEPLRFGFMGRLVPEKGVHLLLEAFQELGGSATLELFAAPAPHAGYGGILRELAARCGARFVGPFEYGGVGAVLDRIDVLVVPSIWWENSPLVIHEAFAAGVPVIAADAGGMAELVTHESDGLLFELGSAESLADALQRMLEPGTLERLASGTAPPRPLAADAAWHLAAYERIVRV